MLTILKKNHLVQRILRKLINVKIDKFDLYRHFINGKEGLEIGGPSKIFNDDGLIPIYREVAILDGCNFSLETTWEGVLKEGPGNYCYNKLKKKGYQYISEAADLIVIKSEKYDLILSSHCLEHVANPIGALYEWLRVLKPDGILVLVVPHKDGTFDHKRPVTELSHLVEDYNNRTSETDLTHLPEILRHHDLKLDPAAGNIMTFTERLRNNFKNRCMHHHTFDAKLVLEVVNYCQWKILDFQVALPNHTIILARKLHPSEKVDNSKFISMAHDYLRNSPFKIDRQILLR